MWFPPTFSVHKNKNYKFAHLSDDKWWIWIKRRLFQTSGKNPPLKKQQQQNNNNDNKPVSSEKIFIVVLSRFI